MSEGLNQFKKPDQVNTTPSLKDLQQYFTPQYAVQWKAIGTQLGLRGGALDIIEHDNYHTAKECCNAMLSKWLQVDTTASWSKLFAVIESPAVSCSSPDKGVEAVTILSKRVREINKQTWLRIKEAWPPEQPKTFTPLLLIQHQRHRNLQHSTVLAEFVERGHIDKIADTVTSTDILPKRLKLDSHEALQEVLDTSKVTKEVAEILAPLETTNDPRFILIEGAPGIGKTVLLKEIAYCWGTEKVLKKFKLVLLVYLRDPTVHQMLVIDELLQLYCKRDRRAPEIASTCSDYLFKNNGEDLVFLFDGYDEYSEKLQNDNLIADILAREVLPRCGLIVSSRPHASVNLRNQATVRVDILGFTEAERQHYITESLKDQPQKIDELTRYLQGHSTISSLCFVPFNIVVLIYLYKQGIPLPKNSSELYNYFICLTVCRHCKKHGGHLQSNITALTDLPEPYNKIIQQLSKLSLHALNDDKLIFNLDEIKEACPDVAAIPGGIAGFDLLQAVEHFGLTGTTTTINFLHFSIQEYLAAYHIANLPDDEQLKIIEKYFWSAVHFNMFSMYISLTNGHPFKQFLCDRNKAIVISDKFLYNQLQCLRLFCCFHEVGDVNISKTIEQSVNFRDKKINLDSTSLTATDVECVSVFLTSSVHQEWNLVDLWDCHIQDHGVHILHRGLSCCSNVTIKILLLNNNSLTSKSSSLISDITIKYRVKMLLINSNHTVGEDKQLYSMLTSSSTMLVALSMAYTKLSSEAAIALFNALNDNSTLKILNIDTNNITDDACDAITTALKMNSCLVKITMQSNPLTGEGMVKIVNGLKVNNTLMVLGLPGCPDYKEQIITIQNAVNSKRESQGCQTKLNIHF